MILLSELIVVEGKSDVAFLSQFIKASFAITNGLNVSQDLLNTISTFLPKPGVIVMTDPDSPGKKIRSQIASIFPDIKHAYIDIAYSKKRGKVGVAESTEKEITRALANIKQYTIRSTDDISIEDLFDLGMYGNTNSSETRNRIAQRIGISSGNAKHFLSLLNGLGITKDTLKQLCMENK